MRVVARKRDVRVRKKMRVGDRVEASMTSRERGMMNMARKTKFRIDFRFDFDWRLKPYEKKKS